MSTLANIRTKVRRVTGLANPQQLSDATIDFYVNTFYLYDLPEQLKLLNLKETYQFYTQPYVASYAFPKNEYTLVEPLIQVNGYETQWFQDPVLFNRTFPTLDVQWNIGVGSAVPSAGPYSGTTSSQPVLAGYTNGLGVIISNVIVSSISNVTGEGMVIRDDGAGGFLDNQDNPVAGASINYLTGAVTAIFQVNGILEPVLPGADILVTFNSYAATRPTSVLFYNDTFTFRPIPNAAYIVNMQAYKVPTELLNASDTPVTNAMWQLLAFGAAQKVFTDLGKLDQAAAYQPYLDEQMDLVRRRALNQWDVQRVATLYSAQLTGQFSNNNFWW